MTKSRRYEKDAKSQRENPPVISKEFLTMIRCPENRSTLALADTALVNQLNDAIRAGRLKNRTGQPVAEFLDGGLVREDKTILYPIIREIPILLVDEGIPLEQVPNLYENDFQADH